MKILPIPSDVNYAKESVLCTPFSDPSERKSYMVAPSFIQDGYHSQGHRHAEGAQLAQRRDHQLLPADDRRAQQGRRKHEANQLTLKYYIGCFTFLHSWFLPNFHQPSHN